MSTVDGAKPSSDTIPNPETKYQVRLFRPSNRQFNIRDVVLPDDFFNPTVADVKGQGAALSSRARDLSDAPLMTKKMRQAEEEAKMARFRKVLIRVFLPDRHILQGEFKPKSTVDDIYKFVRIFLRDESATKFYLFTTPPRQKLADSNRSTLWQEKFVPAAQVRLQVEKGPTETQLLLRKSVLDLIEDHPQPAMPSQAEEASKQREREPKLGSSSGIGVKKDKSKIVPKWFRKK